MNCGLKLWLIRHGEIDAVPGACVGWSDPPLKSPEDADHLAQGWAEEIKDCEKIFSSDMKRAIQTAEPIAVLLECPLNVSSALREMNFGKWENKTWAQIEKSDPMAYERYMKNWRAMKAPDGESYPELKKRVADFFETEIAHAKGDFVIVAHGGSLRILAGLILGWDDEKIMAFSIERGNGILIEPYNKIVRSINIKVSSPFKKAMSSHNRAYQVKD